MFQLVKLCKDRDCVTAEQILYAYIYIYIYIYIYNCSWMCAAVNKIIIMCIEPIPNRKKDYNCRPAAYTHTNAAGLQL
jgi:hypothetical protein